ncbi:hypothetical protein Tco_0696976 [Tanacetum coccineum]
MKQGWCRQAYKDLLWRTASTTSVKEFEKYMLELKKMNPKEHEWKWELTGIPCKHIIVACWNMALNDRVTPPPEVWVGRPKKKRKRSKHEDEPFVKDGKLSKKGRTITCQSCRNIGHNKATCKGQGGNNAEASGLSAADGQGGVGGAGVGVGCQVTETKNADGREMGDGIPTQSSVAGGASEWSFLSMRGYTQLVHDVETSFARLQNHISSRRGYTQLDMETSDNGKFPTVDEEDLPSDSLPSIVINKNKLAVSDNGDAAPTVIAFENLSSGLGGGGYLRDYVRVVAGMDDGDSDSELLIPTPWSTECKNEKRAKRWREEFEWKRSLFEIDLTFGINAFDLDKGTESVKDKVSQEHVCKEEVPLNNNIGKQSGDLVEMPSEAVKQGMDDHVPDEIDGAKCE